MDSAVHFESVDVFDFDEGCLPFDAGRPESGRFSLASRALAGCVPPAMAEIFGLMHSDEVGDAVPQP